MASSVGSPSRGRAKNGCQGGGREKRYDREVKYVEHRVRFGRQARAKIDGGGGQPARYRYRPGNARQESPHHRRSRTQACVLPLWVSISYRAVDCLRNYPMKILGETLKLLGGARLGCFLSLSVLA
jgi:hypothetical protein